MRDMKIAGISVDNELIDGVADMFPGPKLEKGGKTMDLVGKYIGLCIFIKYENSIHKFILMS